MVVNGDANFTGEFYVFWRGKSIGAEGAHRHSKRVKVVFTDPLFLNGFSIQKEYSKGLPADTRTRSTR